MSEDSIDMTGRTDRDADAFDVCDNCGRERRVRVYTEHDTEGTDADPGDYCPGCRRRLGLT